MMFFFSATNIKSILACIMLAVLCVLSAMHIICQCRSNLNTGRRTPADWLCAGLTVLLFALVFAYLCKRTVGRCDASSSSAADTFSDYAWGHNTSSTRDSDSQPGWVQDEHSTKISGPHPGDVLDTWQYNPQNTLVNYAFYDVPANGNPPTQIAPILDGSIGRRDQPPAERVGVGVCNNSPTQQTYAVKSHASAAGIPTGTMVWDGSA